MSEGNELYLIRHCKKSKYLSAICLSRNIFRGHCEWVSSACDAYRLHLNQANLIVSLLKSLRPYMDLEIVLADQKEA